VPLIFAAATGWRAQVAIFAPWMANNTPCLHCYLPLDDESPITSCESLGIMGPVVGMAGLMQAMEAIKWLAQSGAPLVHKLWHMDMLTGQTGIANIMRDQSCHCCRSYNRKDDA